MIETRHLVTIRDLGQVPDIRGAYVKATPTVLASQAFDIPEARAALMAQGALVVQVVPRVVQDTQRPTPVPKGPPQPPRVAVQEWFRRSRLAPEIQAALVDRVMRIVDQCGSNA